MESKESSALIDKWAHQPWDPGRREDSSIYCPAKGKGKNRKYLTNRNRGQEGDLPPGYRDHLLGFPRVIAHVTGLISPAATGCDRPWLGLLTALERANVDPALVQGVYFGNVLSTNFGQAPARQAALGVGISNSVVCTSLRAQNPIPEIPGPGSEVPELALPDV
jgi:hypothetical protein